MLVLLCVRPWIVIKLVKHVHYLYALLIHTIPFSAQLIITCQRTWHRRCIGAQFWICYKNTTPPYWSPQGHAQPSYIAHPKRWCFYYKSTPCFWQRLAVYLRSIPDSKVHGANMEPIWGRQDPGGPHVGPMNFSISDVMDFCPGYCLFNLQPSNISINTTSI